MSPADGDAAAAAQRRATAAERIRQAQQQWQQSSDEEGGERQSAAESKEEPAPLTDEGSGSGTDEEQDARAAPSDNAPGPSQRQQRELSKWHRCRGLGDGPVLPSSPPLGARLPDHRALDATRCYPGRRTADALGLGSYSERELFEQYVEYLLLSLADPGCEGVGVRAGHVARTNSRTRMSHPPQLRGSGARLPPAPRLLWPRRSTHRVRAEPPQARHSASPHQPHAPACWMRSIAHPPLSACAGLLLPVMRGSPLRVGCCTRWRRCQVRARVRGALGGGTPRGAGGDMCGACHPLLPGLVTGWGAEDDAQERAGMPCDACNRSRSHATRQVVLRGRPYASLASDASLILDRRLR